MRAFQWLITGTAALVLSSAPTAAAGQVTDQDYARATSYLRPNIGSLVFTREVEPIWLSGGRFWYQVATPTGRRFRLVDMHRGKSRELFDSTRLRLSLSRASGKALPTIIIDSLHISAALDVMKFKWMRSAWTCNLRTYDCLEERRIENSSGQLLSKDGRWAVRRDRSDLIAVERSIDRTVQLTRDGAEHHAYGSPSEGGLSAVSDARAGGPAPPLGLFSPNGRWLLTHRLDERGVSSLHLVQSSPDSVSELRPRVFSYRYSLPGDSAVPTAQLIAFDMETGQRQDFATAPLLALYPALQVGMAWWHGDLAYWIREHRGNVALELQVGDPATGVVRTIIRELGETFVEPSPNRYPPLVRVIGNGAEVIWYSERSGWGHLYLYDARSGELKNQITAGDWTVREIIHVDESRRAIYFTAGGREANRDPYFRHLYRIGMDGTGLRLLTPEDADHTITASPDGRHFVDVYSRVDLPPKSVLRDAAGAVVMQLEDADVSRLRARGWRWPHRFSVKARDGATDLYGILVLPTAFDSAHSYPVIDEIYQGPQAIRVPKAFSVTSISMAQSIAELGFVVMMLDGLGTPYRSKAFHDIAYGNLGDAGLEDHVSALRQLARGLPFLDSSRVGIYGHSGGGYAAARAVLRYPDFFRAAVASAGNHDQRTYIARWGERYQGVPPEADYSDQANRQLAMNLTGALMLVHGELDDNVHPSNTIALADALIRANKDFDLIIVPNAGHGIFTHPYVVRRRWEFFVRHLHTGNEPRSADQLKTH